MKPLLLLLGGLLSAPPPQNYAAWIADWKIRLPTLAPEARADIRPLLAARLGELWRAHGDLLNRKEPVVDVLDLAEAFGVDAPRFQAEFQTAFLKPAPGEACRESCAVAERHADWARQKFFDRPEGFWDLKLSSGWDYSLATLGAAFLASAAPHCPSARAALAKYGETLAAMGRGGGDATAWLGEISDAADRIHPSTEALKNPLASYGNIFFSMYLHERPGELPPGRIEAVERRAENNLRRFPESLAGHRGSVWHTYLVAIAAIESTPRRTTGHSLAVERLRAVRLEHGPCRFPYRPYAKNDPKYSTVGGEPVSASARSVTANLAIYLDDGKSGMAPERRPADRAALLDSLACFQTDAWKAALQVSAADYHSDDKRLDGLGSHFLYPNLPYIARATFALLEDQALTPAQRARVEEFRDWLHGFLMGLKKKNAHEFRRMGTGEWLESSPAYVSPLIGLALVAYCPRRPVGFAERPHAAVAAPLPH